MLDMILSQAVNGLVLGFLYVLIAIGLSIIFGMLGIVNLPMAPSSRSEPILPMP